MPIKPLGHHELMLLLIQLAVLLFVARACGELCRRLRTPAVVGELSAGVLLGPSIFGALAPELRAMVFPVSQVQADLLAVVTWLGVTFLLLLTGLETDLGLIRRMGRKAPFPALGGLILPFFMGLGLGYYLPETFLAHPGHRLVFMLFVATAMSISAIPVIARILMELGAIRRDLGQLTLACAMIDDTVGWILLSLVAGLAAAGSVDIWLPVRSVLYVGGLILFSYLILRRAVAALYRWLDDNFAESGVMTSMTVILTLLMAALTLSMGLEAILGAFLFGMVLREAPRYRPEITHSLEDFTRLVLSPIFFAAAGTKVSLALFTDPLLLPYALLVLAVACLGKFVGVYIGSRAAGLTTWEALTMGSGLNARGAMEIIVATIGLSLGVLSQQMYSIIVFVAIATSLMAPPLLRYCLSRVEIRPEEMKRLEKERRDKGSFWAGVRKVLLPTRGGGNARFAAELLRQALQDRSAEVTVLGLKETSGGFSFWRPPADDEATRESALKTAELTLRPLASRPKTVNTDGRNAAQLLAELGREHDLVVVGASQPPQSALQPYTFSKLIDELLQASSRPILVVRQPGGEQVSLESNYVSHRFARILVPTTGTSTGRIARELGTQLARVNDAVCTFLFVEISQSENMMGVEIIPPENGPHPLSDVLEGTNPDGDEDESGVGFLTVRAQRAGEAIVDVATDGQYDLIVLNAQLRAGTSRAYLGPQVEFVLANALCPVAILVTQ